MQVVFVWSWQLTCAQKFNRIGWQYYELLCYLLKVFDLSKKVYNMSYLIDRISLLNHRLQEISKNQLFADVELIVGRQLDIAGPFP